MAEGGFDNPLDQMLHHLKHRRLRNQQKLNLIAQTPTSEWKFFTGKVQENAAIKIQAVCRGFLARKKFQRDKETMQKVKAATHIQRWVRKHLRLSKERKLILSQLIRVDLDKKRVEEIEKEIDKWQTSNSVYVDLDEQKQLHYKVQERLKEYHLIRPKLLYRQKKQELQLAQVQSNIERLTEILGDNPILSDLSRIDLKRNDSLLVRMKAKEMHETALENARKPWRQNLMKICDEFIFE